MSETDLRTGDSASSITSTRSLPHLPVKALIAMTIGNLGVSMAFALQSSNTGRIFQTLGADLSKLGFFFILPPLAGLILQPMVGYFSDRTWSARFGRRLPYLIVGVTGAVIMMILLPNSGSFGLGYGTTSVLLFAAAAVLFMDLFSNMAMQPFKMIIGDSVNDDQKSFTWAHQTIWGNVGNIVAAILPFFLTAVGVSNIAAKGELPHSVVWSFYIGAVVLVVTTIFTCLAVKEYDPQEYAQYHGLEHDSHSSTKSIKALLAGIPRVFWILAIPQFFCWIAWQYLWTYGTSAIAANVWQTADPTTEAFQAAGNWFGVMSAVQAVAAVTWGFVISRINKSQWVSYYFGSLVLAAAGFISVFFIHNQYLLVPSFIGIGIGWVTVCSLPFMFLTVALKGSDEGTYVGMFNCTICLPQIVAALLSLFLITRVDGSPGMFLIAGISMAAGAASTLLLRKSENRS